MNKHVKHIGMILLAGMLIIASIMTDNMVVYSNTNKKITKAEERRIKLQDKKAELQKDLLELKNDKKDVLAYIEKVDKKMGKLTRDIVELKTQIKANKKEIKKLGIMIDETQIDINNQYETMKKRIKYMYEHGKTQYLDIVLSSGSISDILSRAEYIQKISDYDKNMLNNYVAAKEELEARKLELVDAKDKLDVAMEELKVEKRALTKMANKKKAELDKYNKSISDTKNEITKSESEIDRQEQIIADALLEQQRKIMEEERKREEERKAEEKRKAEEAAANQSEETDENENGESETEGNDGELSATKAPKATAAPDGLNSVAQVSTGEFRWPLTAVGRITSYFGNRNSPTAGASSYHQGIDIAIAAGTPIVAAKAGTVVTASYSAGAGNYVMINHGDGVFTVYMHASSLAVSVGKKVAQGDLIAYVGSTGVSTGNHLHFGISVNGVYVNPLLYVSQ